MLVLASLVVAAYFVIGRMQADFAAHVRLTPVTAVLVYVLWSAHATLVGGAVWARRAPLPVPRWLGWSAGSVLCAAGLALLVAGLAALGS